MIKSLYRYAAMLLAVVTFGCMASCDDSDDPALNPSIAIRNPIATETSITFTIKPQDATSYGYALTTPEEYAAKTYTLTTVNNGDQKTYTVDNLEKEKFYTIVAVAYNGTMASEEKTLRIKTTNSTVALATVAVEDFVLDKNGNASCVLKVSQTATFMQYQIYPYGSSANADKWIGYTADKDSEDKYLPLNKEKGNQVLIYDYMPGRYVLEASAFVNQLDGEHLLYEFTIEITSRTYVSVGIANVTHKDATVVLEKNSLCKSYYLGVLKAADYTPQAVLDLVKGPNAADYLLTDDYTGVSLMSLIEKHAEAWVPETEVVLWIVPRDEAGNISEDLGYVIKHNITIPETVYEFGGKGTVTGVASDVLNTSYTATLNATNHVTVFYLHDELAKLKKEYPTEEDLIKGLMTKGTPLTAGETTIKGSNREPDTDYVIYAIAQDSDKKLGDLLTLSIHTMPLAFTSAATIVTEATSIGEQDAKVTFTPGNGCTSVRYLMTTDKDFLANFNGLNTRVENALALNSSELLQITTLDLSAGPQSVTLRRLESNTQYLLFALPIDAKNEIGRMPQQLEIKTKKFDLNGTATATISNVRTSSASVGKTLRFTVTPSEGCTGYYVRVLDANTSFSTMNELISTLLDTKAGSGSDYYYDEDGGDAPKKNISKTIYANSKIYVLCRDKDGKYNNPMESPKPEEVSY